MGSVSAKPAPEVTNKAWREILHIPCHWSKQAHGVFKTSISSRFGAKENSEKANILLLGPIASGKSSFVNSVLSVSAGRIVHKAYTGEADHSFTIKYGCYTDKHFFKNFIIHDCMGLEQSEGQGFNVNDVVYLIQGKVPKDYKFNPLAPISEDDPLFNNNPPSDAKVHFVIFVIDATVLYAGLAKEFQTKIEQLQDKIKEMDVPRLLCITKIDKLCKRVNNDLRDTFYSIKVRNVVKRACEIFKIQEGYIHPIKNYEKEVDTNILVDMLLMYPLRQALDFATDYIEEQQ